MRRRGEEDVALIREKADFDFIWRILEIEQQVSSKCGKRHTLQFLETLGENIESVHYGFDFYWRGRPTAYEIYLYKQADNIIRKRPWKLHNIIADKSKRKNTESTIMIGQPHELYTPQANNFLVLNWRLGTAVKRNIERFEHAAAGVEAGKISGAVVTLPTSHRRWKIRLRQIGYPCSRNLYTGPSRDLHVLSTSL